MAFVSLKEGKNQRLLLSYSSLFDCINIYITVFNFTFVNFKLRLVDFFFFLINWLLTFFSSQSVSNGSPLIDYKSNFEAPIENLDDYCLRSIFSLLPHMERIKIERGSYILLIFPLLSF